MLQNLLYIFLASIILNYTFFNGSKNLRYRNWYRPWLLTILTLIALIFKEDVYAEISSVFSFTNYELEIIFCTLFSIAWLLIKLVLIIFKIDDKAEAILKKHNTNKLTKQRRGFANYLAWPYYIEGFSIFKRPGFRLYKYLLLGIESFIIAIYVLSVFFTDSLYFLDPTALGLLLMLIVVEWIIYFSATAKSETEDIDDDDIQDVNVNFYNLFKRYTNEEYGFKDSILFGYIKNQQSKWKKQAEDNLAYINSTVKKSVESNTDFIVSSNDFIDTIPKFSALFFDALKKGGNILILADIPNHTEFKATDVGINHNTESLESISKLFSVYLEQTFEHIIPTAKNLMDIGFYDEKDTNEPTKRIILTQIKNGLEDQLMHSNWIKELDLVVVLQFNDAYVDNLLSQRKFSLWLQQQNIKYKTVLFKIFRTSGDEAFTNTWITARNPEEVKLKNVTTANRNYFINFAYEKSESNLKKLFKGNSHQYDFSPGIELSVFAIMENVKHIHFFEGYNLDYIQSKNALAKSQSALKNITNGTDNTYNYVDKVTQNSLNKAIQINNLPFIVRPFDKFYCNKKHFSVVYDIENNAPKLYQKYRHLGLHESFICIVSKPHLFRDFFAEQISYFSDNTLEALAPQLSKAKINLCLQLFHLLMHEELSMSYIQHLLNQHDIDLKETSVVDFLAELFNTYLHLDIQENAILKYSKSCIFKEGKYQTDQRLTIDKQALETNDVFDYLDDIKVVDSSRNRLVVIPKYLLFQNILPQQNIIINGTSYEYTNFNETTRELVLNAIKTDNQVFYKPRVLAKKTGEQSKEIDAENKYTFFVNGKEHLFQLAMLEAEMEVCHTSYFAFEKYYHSPFAASNTPKLIPLDKEFISKSKRKYRTRYLKLNWEITEDLLEHKELIVTQLHHLLYEFLPVLFPYRHQYVQIASNNNYLSEHRKKTPWVFAEHNFKITQNNNIELYIIEDSFSDLGILKAIQLHFEYIIKNLYDLLLWLQDDKEYFSTDYTEFVKGNAFTKDKLQFLKYGLADENNLWNIEILLKFIKENAYFDNDRLDDNHKKRRSQINLSINVECDYCKGAFKFSEIDVMEDGLHRCAECSVDAIDTEVQIKALEKEAKELYKKHLNIDFSSNKLPYELNFVTATALHNYYNKPFYITNKFDKRTAVGLASDRELDIIHVEKHLQQSATISIVIHEMMHIYQYQRLNFFKMKNSEPQLIEGMTTWAEYLLLSKSDVPIYQEYAKLIDEARMQDQTEYGIGYRYVKEKYGEDMIKRITKKYRS